MREKKNDEDKMRKNMKIAITPEQPLNEVVKELERLGFKMEMDCKNVNHIETYFDGTYDKYIFSTGNIDTTLAELKEMKND